MYYNMIFLKRLILIIILTSLLFFLITNRTNLSNEHFAGKKQLINNLNKTLIKIVKDLDEYNIKNWFIGYGTLLGIVRNNNCIDGDDDIDIIIDKEESTKLHKLIKDKQYNYDTKNGKKLKYNNFTRIILENKYTPIDFYISENKNCNYNETWEHVVWSNVCPIIKKKWNNVNLNLPNNYIKKLEHRYGADWRTPRNWKGPKNNKIL